MRESDRAARVGEGRFAWLSTDWGEVPDGWTVGDVGGIAVDSADNVFVFHRGEHPMLVFDRHGRLLRAWGEGIFVRPHGVHIDAEGFVWCTDDGDHTVRKCSPEGRVLRVLGVPGRPSPAMSGLPFCRCTHTATAPNGELYVTDGYGNACVHRFAPDGTLVATWGRPGMGPGEFNLPHNLVCDGERIIVADRESHRLQVFDLAGAYLASWHGVHRPCALCRGPGGLVYVGEAGPALTVNRETPNLGPRVSVLGPDGALLGRIGAGAGTGLDALVAPHALAVDGHGDVYIGEVTRAGWASAFPNLAMPERPRTLRKWRRTAGAPSVA